MARVLLALVVLALLGPAVPGAAAPGAPSREPAAISAPDGTRLAAEVELPPGPGPFPVVVDAGPYYGRPHGEGLQARGDVYPRVGLLEAGIALVTVSLRGFGGSGGCFDYLGAKDRADMRAVVEWAATRPWSAGRVAVWGYSYDGGAALAALAARPRGLVAAVLASPVTTVYDQLWSQGVHLDDGPLTNVFGPGLSAYDASGPAVGGPLEGELANAGETDRSCYARNTVGLEQPDPAQPFWRERDLADAVGRTRVPVLASYGFSDPVLRLPRLLGVLGGPTRLWLGQFGHVAANDPAAYPGDDLVGRDGFQAEVEAFLGHHLAGRGEAPEGGVVVQEGTGGWREERAWPPRDRGTRTVELLPGSWIDGPGNSAQRTDVHPRVPVPRPRQGVGSWTFTPPLPDGLHVAGVPVVRLRATAPGAQAVALLYDVDPDGTATLLSRGAARLSGSGETVVELHAQDWRVAPGHRLGLLLSGADDGHYRPGSTLSTVQLSGGRLTVPVLRAPRRDHLDGRPGPGVTGRRPFVVDPETVRTRTSGRP